MTNYHPRIYIRADYPFGNITLIFCAFIAEERKELRIILQKLEFISFLVHSTATKKHDTYGNKI